jgi:hypothetical protein
MKAYARPRSASPFTRELVTDHSLCFTLIATIMTYTVNLIHLLTFSLHKSSSNVNLALYSSSILCELNSKSFFNLFG